MKPLTYHELSSLVTFFVKEYKIDLHSKRYINFFLNDFREQCYPNRNNAPVELINQKSGIGFEENSWNHSTLEDPEFYLSRLSKKMSSKEKHCILVLFLRLCKQNNVLQPQRLSFVENFTLQLGINSNALSLLKKITLFTFSPAPKPTHDDTIMVLQQKDIVEISKTNSVTILSNALSQVLAYVCVSQEQIAFIKTSAEKSEINGNVIEPNKVYPLMEGDVLKINEIEIYFNELFRHYYCILSFPALLIDATENTPAIHFDPQQNRLEIKGSSIPEDGFAFFRPLLKWVDSYLHTAPNYIVVKIQLDYFNTTSSKFILDIFKKLESYKKENVELIVNWYFAFGDDDLEEAGLNYSEMVKIPFALIPYN